MKRQMMEEMEEARKKKAAVAEAAKREEQRVSERAKERLDLDENLFIFDTCKHVL